MEPLTACAQRWNRSLVPVGRALRFCSGGIRAVALAMVLAR